MSSGKHPFQRAAALSDAAARLVASPPRLAIVQHLQLHGPLTSAQLADLADVETNSRTTAINVTNRHIAGLLKDGWITVAGTLTNDGRAGRPERVLALSAEHDWTGLVSELNARAADLPGPS